MASLNYLIIFIFSVNFFIEGTPPIVLNPIPDRTVIRGEPFSFSIPSNTFFDSNGEYSFRKFTASLSHNDIEESIFPDWLLFKHVSDINTLGSCSVSYDGRAVDISDDHNIAYVGSRTTGAYAFSIINITNMSNPFVISSITNYTSELISYIDIKNNNVKVVNDTVIMATDKEELQFYNVKNPLNPIHVFNYSYPYSEGVIAHRLSIIDNTLYVLAQTGIYSLDITDISNPVILPSKTCTTFPSSSYDFAFYDNPYTGNLIVYTAAGDNGIVANRVFTYNIESSFINIDTYGYGISCQSVAVYHRYLYAGFDNKLIIFDIYTDYPDYVSSYSSSVSTIFDIVIHNSYLYLNGFTSTEIISLEDPTQPVSYSGLGISWQHIRLINDVIFTSSFSIIIATSTASLEMTSFPNFTSYVDITVTAFDTSFENVSDTFRLNFLEFTSTNVSSISMNAYLFDLLNNNLIESIYFFLSNDSLDFNLSITEKLFSEYNDHYDVSFSSLSNSEFIFSIFFNNPFEGFFPSTLKIICNSPSNTTCAVIPIYLNIIGPVASPNTTSITFPSFSSFDIISRPLYDDLLCQSLSLTPNTNYTIPANPQFVLNVTYDFSGDEYFSVEKIDIIDGTNYVHICIISEIPKSDITTIIDFTCNDNFLSDCGSVTLKGSISGPFAILNTSSIDFGDISTYDILSRSTSSGIFSSISLSPVHYFSVIEYPEFYISPSITLDSLNNLFFITTDIVNNHDLIITFKLIDYNFKGDYNVSVHLQCNNVPSSDCGNFSIFGNIVYPSYNFISTPINFEINEYDIIVRSNRIFLGSYILSPNNLLPIPSSPSFMLNASTNISDINYIETEIFQNGQDIILDIFIPYPTIPKDNINVIVSILCNDVFSSNCGEIPINGSILSPIYSLSSTSIEFHDIVDANVVDNNTKPFLLYFTINNMLIIPIDDLNFDFEVNCTFSGNDVDNFAIIESEMLYNSTGKYNDSSLAIGEIKHYITIDIQNIHFPRSYSSILKCSTNEVYIESAKEIELPVSILVTGSYANISITSIYFHATLDSISHETFTVNNIGNEDLDINMNIIGDSESSFSFGNANCSSISFSPGEYCIYDISFTPSEIKLISNIFIVVSTNSYFQSNFYIPINAAIHYSETLDENEDLITQLVDIAPYLIATIIFVMLLLIIVSFVGKRRKVSDQQPLMIILVYITLYDFISDILFTYSLRYKTGFEFYIFLAAVFSIVISFCINVIVLMTFVTTQLKKPIFREWFVKTMNAFTVIAVLSSTNLSVMRLITSNIMGLTIFSCPLSHSDAYRLASYSLITYFTEDIPQLIIQGYFAINIEFNQWPLILMLSMFGTILSLIFGIFNRVLGWLFVIGLDKDIKTGSSHIIDPSTIDISAEDSIETPLENNHSFYEKSDTQSSIEMEST